ncbi:MAG: hypothetical protein WBG08_06775 [Litorimonas sp.]
MPPRRAALWLTLAAVALCLLYVVLSGLFVLGDFQTRNGDYYQYQIHVDNLREGLPWNAFLDGFPVVFPGWPLMLLAWQSLFGDGFHALGMLNACLWAGTSLIYFQLVGRLGWAALPRLSLLVVLLLSPYVIGFQQEGQPNIASAFALSAALYGGYRLSDAAPRTRWATGRYAALVLLPSLVRLEGVVAQLAIAIFLGMRRQWRALAWPLLGIGLALALTAGMAHLFGLTSSFAIVGHFRDNAEPTDAAATLATILGYMAGLLTQMADIFLTDLAQEAEAQITVGAGEAYRTTFGLPTLILLALAAVGFVSAEPRAISDDVTDGAPSPVRVLVMRLLSFATPLRLTLVGTLAYWALVSLPNIPLRYILPAGPIFAVFAVGGLSVLLSGLGRASGPVVALCVLLWAAWTWTGLDDHITLPERRTYATHPEVSDMYDHMAELVADGRAVGDWKPRILMGELRRRDALRVQAVQMRTIERFDALIEAKGTASVVDPFLPQPVRDYLAADDRICKVWKKGAHVIYSAADDRVCLPEQ